MRFPETTHSWRRLKLNLAQVLVIGLVKGDHSIGFRKRLCDIYDEIDEFKEIYYPARRR